ncbi:S9 family peptidase [Acetobacter sacchari]|uniref:S9 family peptidase n=1 Tax=Acetobacter sacchari TaxID=2661687 RepID=A0ABS3LXD1_9PROT|nr:S9 family peptidase [Acetobacter sacchari]MBO1360568.1 S9 family peptidase [Acetobacter sacchari]
MTEISLIPRAFLFGNPENSPCILSPNGNFLAWTSPIDSVSNIWVAPRSDLTKARCITNDRVRGIFSFSWCHDNEHLLYGADTDGDENWRIFAVNHMEGAAGPVVRDLTPGENIRASVAATSRFRPDEILIYQANVKSQYSDVYIVNLKTGSKELVFQNSSIDWFLFDDFFNIILGAVTDKDGSISLMRKSITEEWTLWRRFALDDARVSQVVGLNKNADTVYLVDSQGRDTAALLAVSLSTGEESVLASDSRADINGYIGDPVTYEPLAYFVNYTEREIVPLNSTLLRDFEILDNSVGRGWSVLSRSVDDQWWTVGLRADTRPGSVYLYDRHNKSVRLLYDVRPELNEAPLVEMTPHVLQSRDGLSLVSYLSLPKGTTPAEPPPLVLVVHGGPWVRDNLTFEPVHQWLANRGYAALSVNFRSSTGFGKAFIEAGNLQWGASMDDDLEDAVQWAIEKGYADPLRLGIMGASYGGYAVLSALTRHPERYACGIDIVGPSNLESLLEAIPAYWESQRAMLYSALGDPRTAEGAKLLRDRSPIYRAKDIRRPLLIGQGANDPRVPESESRLMVQAMRESDVPVTYVLYPDEGHGFQRDPNRLSFYRIAEEFLTQWLGGRCEPPSATEEEGTTAQLL